ncbi:hypothetical protein [Methylomonas koyamae]|uniref:IPTL-CTERM protein sorting domain-containing protein n=1 Tax=Methylomonas koyamae TaxID=702114 RepID=A0AA91DD49_9GAMM|nr:hypothetical protein [Methylomonas koyamae]OAI26880.1 hypothetical protein A1356_10740 [Methylomonas koyamae]
MKNTLGIALPVLWLAAGPALAGSSLSVEAVADTFLSSDPLFANRDMSNFGVMVVSADQADPAQGSTHPRRMNLLVAYDTAPLKAGFDAEFGPGGWRVDAVAAQWYSTYDIPGTPANNPRYNVPAAGAFSIVLLADNAWFDPAKAAGPGLANADLNWNSVFGNAGAYAGVLAGAQTLGVYRYSGGTFNSETKCAQQDCAAYRWDLGSNPTLLQAVLSGDPVSLFAAAADDQVAYLVNQRGSAGGHPLLVVTASAVPLPPAAALFAGALLLWRRFAPRHGRSLAAPVLALSALTANAAQADTTLSVEATADTFLSSDPTYADRDMSAFGAMQISANLPDPLQGIDYPRTMDLLVAYRTAAIKSGFDAQYGAGNWHVTAVKVKWYSNFDIIGEPAHNPQFNVPAVGNFSIAWLANDNWFDAANAGAQGLANPDLNWNSVFGGNGAYSGLLNGKQILGTYSYSGGTFNGTSNCSNEVCAPRFWDLGSNAGLFNRIQSGGVVSLLGFAADTNVTYLANQLTKPAAHPQLFVSAAAGAPTAVNAVPLPDWALLLMAAILALLLLGSAPASGAGTSRDR